MGLHATLPTGVHVSSLAVVCCESGLCTPVSQDAALPHQKQMSPCPCTSQWLSDPGLLQRHAQRCFCFLGSMSAKWTASLQSWQGLNGI